MNTKSSQMTAHRLGKSLLLIFLLLACRLPDTNLPTSPYSQFTNRIIVSLTEPPDGEAYPISAGLSIRGEAISDGSIARMELWVDGELYETYTAPESDLGLLMHYWDWSPRTLGTHTLMVRAYNDQNQTAFSNAIHIKGVEDTGFVVVAKAEEGRLFRVLQKDITFRTKRHLTRLRYLAAPSHSSRRHCNTRSSSNKTTATHPSAYQSLLILLCKHVAGSLPPVHHTQMNEHVSQTAVTGSAFQAWFRFMNVGIHRK